MDFANSKRGSIMKLAKIKIEMRMIMKTAKGKAPSGEKSASGASAEMEVSLPRTCYVGLFICSHEEDVLETGVFHDVELRKE